MKEESQQSLLMLHRVREQLLKQRTVTVNALRTHLAEFGIVAAQRRTGLRELLAVVADAEDRLLPPLARELLQGLLEHLRGLEERTAESDRRLIRAARDGGACERLAVVPAIGPVIATALAAWLGLMPRQHSSRGKGRLFGISKRGNAYLRRQLMHGARVLVAVSEGREGGSWSCMSGLLARRPFNVVVAVVSNKLARVARALLSRGEDYCAAAA